MKDRIRRRFSSAHAMAAVSLFVALSVGGAWAAGIPKNSVRSKQIKDSAVVAKDVRDESLTAADVQNGTLGGEDVRDDALTGADVDEASLSLPQADPTPRGQAGGSLAGEYPNPSLAAASVGADQVTDDSLGSADLAPDGVGSSEVAPNSLRAEDLATNGVDSAEIASSAVGASEVDENSIDSDEVSNESLGAAELAAGSVGASEIENGSLAGDDIGRESGTVTFDGGLLAANNCTAREIDVGVDEDMRSDLVAVTLPVSWPAALQVQPVNSLFVGHIGLTICNVSGVALDPLPIALRWIAIDV